MRKIISKNPLFFAFLFPAVMDGVVTLLGQDSSYWSGNVVNEASPAYYVLLVSPWLFVLGSFVWFLFWYWLFRKLKEPVNLFLMFLFIAGHAWGSTSWIWKMMKTNGIYVLGDQISIIFAWGIALLYFVVIATVATYCFKIYLKKR